MIPNALTSPSPYADLWSHLKAVDYALQRSLDSNSKEPLHDLDRERLLDLASFLHENLDVSGEDLASFDSLLASADTPVHFTTDIDVKKCLKDTKEFSEWLSKTRFDEKVSRLITSIEEYVKSSKQALFPKNSPRPEFIILSAFLMRLLSYSQPDAYAEAAQQ